MCGIVGYIGDKAAVPVLMMGLERLSYRGYDSAGVAVIAPDGHICVRKTKGRLDNLQALLERMPAEGCAGIGHTRWATHGEPSEVNAHPQTDRQKKFAVVHNGIIENHDALRKQLKSKGAQFVSQTDTEVIAHLLCLLYDGDMCSTLGRAMGILQGSYALGVLCESEPHRLYGACSRSPLVLGFRDGQGFLASDVPALLNHTRDVVFLQDGEIGVLAREGVSVYDAEGKDRRKVFIRVDWALSGAQKDGFDHYMLKEIHEQPKALKNTFVHRACAEDLRWLPMTQTQAKKIRKITIAACGSAYHAALFGKYVLEKHARIPVEAALASEYRYRDVAVGNDEWFIAVSQSGETADTLAAMREAGRRGMEVLAVCNAMGSSIAREAGELRTLYTQAGPEMAVASTKAFLTQAQMMILLAAAIAKLRGYDAESCYEGLAKLPHKVQEALKLREPLIRIAGRFAREKQAFFVGRGLDYPLSMEGALKLKEVSYVFSLAYAAGELKHGPIALLENGTLVVACLTQPALAEKTMSNLQEVRARGARVFLICTQQLAERAGPCADALIAVPDADETTAPLVAAVPLQLFAYYMAVQRGCDVDKPRNLAKSVTVE